MEKTMSLRNEIIDLIKRNLMEIVPGLKEGQISYDDRFADLGADSVDRGELITLTLERLNLDLPRVEFAGANTINELTDLIVEKKG